MATLSSTPAAGSASASELYPAHDQQLVAECLQGNPAAWDRFVDRFAGLFAFVIDRTASQRQIPLAAADRDDLLAETLLEILQRDAAVLRAFRGNSALATYLAVIARRLSVRGLARLSGRRRPHVGSADAALVAHSDDGPAHVENREQIERLLLQLPPAESELIRLFHLEGRSYGEISRMTGMSLGSIGPMLARARQKLRERDE